MSRFINSKEDQDMSILKTFSHSTRAANAGRILLLASFSP